MITHFFSFRSESSKCIKAHELPLSDIKYINCLLIIMCCFYLFFAVVFVIFRWTCKPGTFLVKRGWTWILALDAQVHYAQTKFLHTMFNREKKKFTFNENIYKLILQWFKGLSCNANWRQWIFYFPLCIWKYSDEQSKSSNLPVGIWKGFFMLYSVELDVEHEIESLKK